MPHKTTYFDGVTITIIICAITLIVLGLRVSNVQSRLTQTCAERGGVIVDARSGLICVKADAIIPLNTP